jgi:hypothetical protein
MTNKDAAFILGILKECVTEKTVHVPSTDYYARRGDFEEETIRYVDLWKLEAKLEELLDDA